MNRAKICLFSVRIATIVNDGNDLHNVVQPWGRVGSCWMTSDTERSKNNLDVVSQALILNGGYNYLCDNSTNFSRGSRETVGGGTVSSWEAFTRNDKSGGVRSEIEEELAQDVECEQSVTAQLVISLSC